MAGARAARGAIAHAGRRVGFTRQEVDGNVLPASMLTTSRLLIDGDRFRTETPGANYDGVFNINVESQPHEIDIEFIEGPEAGNSNFGIFQLEGEQLELCLDLSGRPRPKEFRTSAGSGRAFQTLQRASKERPLAVIGGVAPAPRPEARVEDIRGFDFSESLTLTKLQGDWAAVQVVLNGQPLPSMMLRGGLRTATKNEIRISFSGQTVIHALVRLDETANPIAVDYYNLDGPTRGKVQEGIFKWSGDDACFCMAASGQPRPTDFTSAVGSERTLSQWKRKK